MSNKSNFDRKIIEKYEMVSQKIIGVRTEPAKPNALASNGIRSSRTEYARVERNTLESNGIRSSRTEYARVEPSE